MARTELSAEDRARVERAATTLGIVLAGLTVALGFAFSVAVLYYLFSLAASVG